MIRYSVDTRTAKWFATVTCELEPQPLPQAKELVGIDIGLKAFAFLSTGEAIDAPKFLCSEETALKRAHRSKEKAEKGMPLRERRRKVLVRVYERIANNATTLRTSRVGDRQPL